jgi:pseudouridylate synthase
MNEFLDIGPEAAEALASGSPVVALESTIISHGMPYPENVRTALAVEAAVRAAGAVPATIAVMGGRLKAGLSGSEIEALGSRGSRVAKASRRDLPFLVSAGLDGATTVAATMIVAAMAGIRIFATGGIGGVHRGGGESFDVSADLEELGRTEVAVVCAGAKSILDIGMTLEYLETRGVPVIGYGTDEFPAFFARSSGFPVDYRLDAPEETARALIVKWGMGIGGGAVIANPIPAEYAMDGTIIDSAIATALDEARLKGVTGKALTPYLLARINDLTGGGSLEANVALVLNDARAAAEIAVAYSALVTRTGGEP